MSIFFIGFGWFYLNSVEIKKPCKRLIYRVLIRFDNLSAEKEAPYFIQIYKSRIYLIYYKIVLNYNDNKRFIEYFSSYTIG